MDPSRRAAPQRRARQVPPGEVTSTRDVTSRPSAPFPTRCTDEPPLRRACRNHAGFDDDAFDGGFEADDDFAFAADPLRRREPLADVPALEDERLRGRPRSRHRRAAPSPAPASAAGPEPGGGAAGSRAESAFGDSRRCRASPSTSSASARTRPQRRAAAAGPRLSRATTRSASAAWPRRCPDYQNEPTPSLIVVESLEPTARAAGRARPPGRGLRPRHQGGGHRRHQRHRALPRADAARASANTWSPPLQPLQLIAAISGLFADPAQPFVGRSIAFVGARGRRRRLDRRPQHRLRHVRADRRQHRHRRLRPAVRHRRPGLQPGPAAGRRRRAQPARPPRPGAAGPDDGPLHRQAAACSPRRPRSTTTRTSPPRPSRR